MISIGRLAKQLREQLGWTQRETADALQVSYVHLCNVENEKSQPSQSLLDRYRDLWGIDLYVFAWCKEGNGESLPAGVRRAASRLEDALQARLEQVVLRFGKESNEECSIFDK